MTEASDQKSFNVIVTKGAHANLRKLAKEFKIGQNYILNAILDSDFIDPPTLAPFIEEARRQREAARRVNSMRAMMAELDEDERKQVIEGLDQK